MKLMTIIINEAPYGSEKVYNGLRTAIALQKQEGVEVKVFLMADATTCGLKNQTTPDGFYNLGRMIERITRRGEIGACGSCMDARGLKHLDLIKGVHRSTMDELSSWIVKSDNIITF